MNEIQTRSETTGLMFHRTLDDAFKRAKRDDSVWKISFYAHDGTRIRLIRITQGWLYEDINGNREL